MKPDNEGRLQSVDRNGTVLITETLLDSKSLFNANAETICSMMWLDLKGRPLIIVSAAA